MSAYPIPSAALTQHTLVLGKTGSGKSSVLRGLVERHLSDQQPVCIIDPKGDWWGIKSSADGKSAGFPLVIFGGEHADVPINAHAGAQVAELYATGNRPCLIDLGGWMPGDRTRFFIDFASTLFRLTRGARWLVIDEVHNFAPQGKVMDPDAGRMLHWANRIITEGRGKGVTVLSASQRPQKVHKDFVTSNETLIAMRVIHELDRLAMKSWIDGCGDPEKGREVLSSLANMKRGEGWVWSPEIGFGPKRITFPLFTTYDSFAPQSTEADRHPKGWAEVDLDDVKAKLASAIEQAEKDDPKLLRAEIAKLEREIAHIQQNGNANPGLLDLAKRNGYEEGRQEFETWRVATQRDLARRLSLVREQFDGFIGELEAEAAKTSIALPAENPRNGMPKPPDPDSRARDERRALSGNGAKASTARQIDAGGATLSKAERLILTALAQYPLGRSKVQVAVLTGYSAGGGGFSNAVSALRTKGCVEGDAARLVITPGGNSALGHFDPLPHGPALLQHWYGQLGKAERKALETLAEVYPRTLSKAQLANRSGYEPNGGGFNNALSRLRTLELIQGRAELKASADFFQ